MPDLTEEYINSILNNIIKETTEVYLTYKNIDLTRKEQEDLILNLKEYILSNIYAFHIQESGFDIKNYEENTTIH